MPKNLFFYVAVLLVFGTGIWFILRSGSHLQPDAAVSAATAPSAQGHQGVGPEVKKASRGGIVAVTGAVAPSAGVVVGVVVPFGAGFGFGAAPGRFGFATAGVGVDGPAAIAAPEPDADADALAPIVPMIDRNAERLSPATSRRVAAAGCRRRIRGLPAVGSSPPVAARRAASRAMRSSISDSFTRRRDPVAFVVPPTASDGCGSDHRHLAAWISSPRGELPARSGFARP